QDFGRRARVRPHRQDHRRLEARAHRPRRPDLPARPRGAPAHRRRPAGRRQARAGVRARAQDGRRRGLPVRRLLPIPPVLGGLTAAEPVRSAPAADGGRVPTTILRGADTYPTNPVVESAARPGDVSLNFPAVDIHVLAKAVLGDMLKQSYTVAPNVNASVTLV